MRLDQVRHSEALTVVGGRQRGEEIQRVNVDQVVLGNRDLQGLREGRRKDVAPRPLHRKVTNLDALDPLGLGEGHREVAVAVDGRRIDREIVAPSRQLATQLETRLRRSPAPRRQAAYQLYDSDHWRLYAISS